MTPSSTSQVSCLRPLINFSFCQRVIATYSSPNFSSCLVPFPSFCSRSDHTPRLDTSQSSLNSSSSWCQSAVISYRFSLWSSTHTSFLSIPQNTTPVHLLVAACLGRCNKYWASSTPSSLPDTDHHTVQLPHKSFQSTAPLSPLSQIFEWLPFISWIENTLFGLRFLALHNVSPTNLFFFKFYLILCSIQSPH